MNVKNELETIIEILSISKEDLSTELSIGRQTLYRWLKDDNQITYRNAELVFDYAFKNHIYLNNYREMFLKEENEKNNQVVLFHGSKNELEGHPDLSHSKDKNDFGDGFYLGESFEQAATYICSFASHNVYAFKIDLSHLNVARFSVSKEWMLAIAYYRGWIDKYKNNSVIKQIIDTVENSDLIIAPIADNRMFDIISEFATGFITDEQCVHALSATNLGMQYIIKTKKALKELIPLKQMYVCNREKEFFIKKEL